VDTNAGDRNALTLNGDETLISASAAVRKNSIIVQHVAGPVIVESWIEHSTVITDVHTLAKHHCERRTGYPGDLLYTRKVQRFMIAVSGGVVN
jgi:hypothetical protein